MPTAHRPARAATEVPPPAARRWTPAALLVAAWVAGCAPALEPGRAEPPIPERFAVPAELAGPGLEAAQVHWRTFFQDPRLHALIEAALQHNRDLRMAAARVQEARAQWALTKAERWPALQLFGGARLERVYAPGLASDPERRLDVSLASSSFELDFFGRLASLSEAARADYLATEEARRATELAMIAQVAELYLSQRQVDEMLSRAQSALASREQTVQILERARDIGISHDLELEQARVQLEATRAQLAQLGLAQRQIEHVMQLLVGRVPAALPEGLPTEQFVASHQLAVGLPGEVLLMRPDVMAAEHRLASARASVKAARAAFFPRVALTANLGTASADLTGLFKAGAWSFQPTVALPIFDGGRAQAGWDMARARESAVVAQYERTVQQAFREVADQLAARSALALQAAANERSLQAQRNRLRIHRQRHEAGLSGYLEVLEAERELLAAEQSQIALRRAQLDAVVGLYRALGGGMAVGKGVGVASAGPSDAGPAVPAPGAVRHRSEPEAAAAAAEARAAQPLPPQGARDGS